jgi:lysophospholipase L1-like esterase
MDHPTLLDAFARTDAVLREVAAAKNADLIDASAHLTGRSEMFEDHIHLSTAGSAKMARFVADQLGPLLRRGDDHPDESAPPPPYTD